MGAPRIATAAEAPPAALPLDDHAFEELLAPLGPFEPSPHVAVAVSGGSDSLALCLLTDRWARARGGAVTALTVDHGLRPESAAEATTVADWLAARDIAHRILRWRGAAPATRIQETARAARLSLLAGFCARARILHLLLAHQREDQAETVLQRLAGGSGVDGLAAMAPVRLAMDMDGAGVRLLRPLLSVPRDSLKATLAAFGQCWVDDPTNRDSRHARPRLASVMAALEAEGLGVARLGRTARRAADDRAALEAACAAFLGECAQPSPAGFVLLERRALVEAPRALALRCLARVVVTVSGASYPPRTERLERLGDRLLEEGFRAGTLGGCRIVPWNGRLLICREAAAASHVSAMVSGRRLLWDGRFVCSLAGDERCGPFTVRRLGTGGLASVRAAARERGAPIAAVHVPAPARAALPALFDLDGPLAVPHLNFVDEGRTPGAGVLRFAADFRPTQSLASGATGTLRVETPCRTTKSRR